MCKVYNAKVVHNVVDRALQVHGSLGYGGDMPLESMYRMARMASLVDGANEVQVSVAKSELARYSQEAGPEHVPTRWLRPVRGSPTCAGREPHRGGVRRPTLHRLAGAGDR
jgi:hypothetical protein